MRHRILITLILIALIAAQGAVGTAAYFSDNHQNAGNTFTAWQSNTVKLLPNAGVDETNGTYNLSVDDLNALGTSDGDCYQTQDDWDNNYSDDEYLSLTFPDIPASAAVTDVSITLEWSKQAGVFEDRLKVFDGLGNEQIYALPLPGTGQSTETVDLSAFIDTVEKVNNLQVWFQALANKSGPGKPCRTSHDLIEVTVVYD